MAEPDPEPRPSPGVSPLDYQAVVTPEPTRPLTPVRVVVVILSAGFGGLIVLAFAVTVVWYAAAILVRVFPR